MRISNGHCNRSQVEKSAKNKFPTKLNLKWKTRNIPYIQQPVKTDIKAFLSKVCLGEGKSFYDISLRMNWHSQPNSIMELQKNNFIKQKYSL